MGESLPGGQVVGESHLSKHKIYNYVLDDQTAVFLSSVEPVLPAHARIWLLLYCALPFFKILFLSSINFLTGLYTEVEPKFHNFFSHQNL